MLITKEIEIDMAHRVCFHKSKCRNLHWHRYKIEVGVDDRVIDTYGSSDYGMVIDFSDLKAVMIEELDERFDHGAVFFKEDPYRVDLEVMIYRWEQNPDKLHFVDFMPTAENLCKYWYNIIEPRLKEFNIAIAHVKIWETPTSTAIYTKENKASEIRAEQILKYNNL